MLSSFTADDDADGLVRFSVRRRDVGEGNRCSQCRTHRPAGDVADRLPVRRCHVVAVARDAAVDKLDADERLFGTVRGDALQCVPSDELRIELNCPADTGLVGRSGLVNRMELRPESR